MPDMPKTPLIAVRVPREDQDALKRIAEADGVSVSEVVRGAIAALIASRQGV